MTGLPRRLLLWSLAALAWACSAAAVSACPFCTMQGQTLTNEVTQASIVLYGSLRDAKLSDGGLGEGTTKLVIDQVIKKHEILEDKTLVTAQGDKKVLTLNRYVPTDPSTKDKFLVFCDVFKGKIDPYRGMPVKADSDIAGYLEGAMKVKDKEIGPRLKYFFNYLDNGDQEISNDAYKEFGNASYAEYRDMAKQVPADKLAKWLQDPNTPAFRYGLYASMLGHCGNEQHAKLLRSMLDDSDKRVTSGLDGIMAGYTLLKPQEGWAYINDTLKDEKKDFTVRYAALRTVRFFWDSRPDVVEKKKLVEGVCQLLEQSDIADLAIEDLRKWSQWQAADKVLDLRNKPSHNVPIIRRAILRYALSCPENTEAVAYVDDLRKKDARMVKDAEELLKLENAAQAPTKK
jgi:hypothetical protein